MKITLLMLLLGGCAHFTSRPEISQTPKDVPEWVYSPYDGCAESEELCATGEGRNRSQADAQAKANLASIFEVKISSDTNITLSGGNTFPWHAQVREDVQKSLNESVQQVLENVQIKKYFRKDGISHSLASLNRKTGGELLGNRVKKIDTELETLWAGRQRTNLRRIVKLYLEREKLNERFSIVAGQGKPSPVKWKSIVKWRESRPKSEPLLLKVGQAPEWMTEKLEELLTESGFRPVKADANKVVTLHVDSIKEYLNVNGFEKYTFTLNMASIEDGQKKKNISTSETVTGRTQADALLKVKDYFINYIEEHLSDLHLD